MAATSSDAPGFTSPNNAPSTSAAPAASTSAPAAPAATSSSQAQPAPAASTSSSIVQAATTQQQQPATTSTAQSAPQSSSSQPFAPASSSAAATSSSVAAAGPVTVTSTLAASTSAATSSSAVNPAVPVSTVTTTPTSSASSSASSISIPTSTSSTPSAPTATLRANSNTLSRSQSSTLTGSGTNTGSRGANGAAGLESKSLSGGAIGGIAAGAVVVLLLLGLGVWGYRKRKARKDRDEWPLPPPRDMIAAGGTGYGGGWDDKPTAGAGVASSTGMLGYGSGSGEKGGFDRSTSALYVPGLPAHYPSYARRTSTQPLSPGSGSSTPALGPAFSYDQPLAPMMMPAAAGQGQYYRPSSPSQQQGGTGDFAQGPFLFQHDQSPGGSGSGSGSRSSTPVGRGVGGGSNSNLRGEAVVEEDPSDHVASGRRLPPPIQTTGLNDVLMTTNPDVYGSAPSTPRSSSRHSYNPQHASQGYAQPYYPSSATTPTYPQSSSNPSVGLRTSYSRRSVNLQMPAPLDPNTPRQGYLSPPTSPRPGSMYGLNEFGSYQNPNASRSSRPGSGSGSGSRGSGSYSPSGGESVHSSTRLQGGKRASAVAGFGGHGVSHQPSTSSSLASGPSGDGDEETTRAS